MNQKKIKIQITFRKTLRYFYILAIILSASIFTYTSLFLYKHVYQAIFPFEIIAAPSKNEILAEDVNMLKFNTVIENFEKKTKEYKLEYFKDIF